MRKFSVEFVGLTNIEIREVLRQVHHYFLIKARKGIRNLYIESKFNTPLVCEFEISGNIKDTDVFKCLMDKISELADDLKSRYQIIYMQSENHQASNNSADDNITMLVGVLGSLHEAVICDHCQRFSSCIDCNIMLDKNVQIMADDSCDGCVDSSDLEDCNGCNGCNDCHRCCESETSDSLDELFKTLEDDREESVMHCTECESQTKCKFSKVGADKDDKSVNSYFVDVPVFGGFTRELAFRFSHYDMRNNMIINGFMTGTHIMFNPEYSERDTGYQVFITSGSDFIVSVAPMGDLNIETPNGYVPLVELIKNGALKVGRIFGEITPSEDANVNIVNDLESVIVL